MQKSMESIDLFSLEMKDSKDYIYVGNVENENSESRISELAPIRVICTNDAKDIYGKKLTTHKAVRIHKDDYNLYNDLIQNSMRKNYQWN